MEAARWLGAATPEWDGLLRDDPNATASHCPGLWAAIAAAIPGAEVAFLAVEEEGRLEGGMPVVIERRAGLHWLHAMPWVLPGAPLARPGAHVRVDAAAARALSDLQRGRRAVGGLWSLYRPAGPPVDAAALAAVSGVSRRVETRIVSLERGLDAAWRGIDRKTRQALAHAREALATGEEPGALAEAFALHARQARRWGGGYRPLPLELARRLLEARGPDGEPVARLFTARDRRGLLSAVFVLDHGAESFLWWSGTRPEGRARQAFGAVAWTVVERAARRGRRRVNLGASPGLDAVSSFKHSLGGTSLAYGVRWMDARHAPWAGRLLAALRHRAPAGSPP